MHSSEEAIRAFSSAREAGFSNVSIDLIFSVPDVSEPAWKGSVDRAISLQPEHISAYALTIEEGTLFAKREREGMLVVLTEDDDALQYDWTRHRLMDAGFGQWSFKLCTACKGISPQFGLLDGRGVFGCGPFRP